MLRQSKRKKLQISQWYVGAGNNISVFTQKPNTLYTKIKDRYIKELQKHYKQGIVRQEIPLTEEQRVKIKNRVRKSIKKDNLNMLKALVLAFIFTTAVILLLVYLFFR
jgi:hypothetical protein